MKMLLESCDKIGKSLLNLVYPIECEICKAGLGPYKEGGLCDECKSKIRLGASSLCSDNVYHFRGVWAMGSYGGILKECILLFKLGRRMMLLPGLIELLSDFAKLNIKIDEFDILVPVPLHRTKARERTFNQSELLAKGLSLKLGLTCHPNNLIKIKHLPPQSQLNKNQRALNIKGAFRVVDESLFKNKNILLIDDVFTTGCTLDECAKMILAGGAKGVSCLVVARG